MKNFTVEMSNGSEVYFPAAQHRTNTSDFTSKIGDARRMSKSEANTMVERITMFSKGVTGRVVSIG